MSTNPTNFFSFVEELDGISGHIRSYLSALFNLCFSNIIHPHCSTVIRGYADPPDSLHLSLPMCVFVIIIFHFNILLQRWRGGDISSGGGGDDGLNGTLSARCLVYFISFAKSLPTAKSHFFFSSSLRFMGFLFRFTTALKRNVGC